MFLICKIIFLTRIKLVKASHVNLFFSIGPWELCLLSHQYWDMKSWKWRILFYSLSLQFVYERIIFERILILMLFLFGFLGGLIVYDMVCVTHFSFRLSLSKWGLWAGTSLWNIITFIRPSVLKNFEEDLLWKQTISWSAFYYKQLYLYFLD